jgi:hypothetical protein
MCEFDHHVIIKILKGILSALLVLVAIRFLIFKKKLAKTEKAKLNNSMAVDLLTITPEALQLAKERDKEFGDALRRYYDNSDKYSDWLIMVTMLLGLVDLLATFTE